MPRNLPVSALSVSSLRTLRMCPTRWRFKYVDKRYEPSGPAALLGKAFGAAEATSDHHWIEHGAPLTTDETLDAYVDEFDYAKSDTEVDWQGLNPDRVKDSAVPAIRLYHAQVPQLPVPVEAERKIELDVESDAGPVPFVAYLDVEREDGSVEDRKFTGRRKITQDTADGDPQATAYLAGRRAEGNPAERFVFDVVIAPTDRDGNPKQAQTERIATPRSDEQLDHFLLDILGAADEIQWRLETDNWSYAAEGVWWCSERWCSWWGECPAGGLLRKRAAQAVRNGSHS